MTDTTDTKPANSIDEYVTATTLARIFHCFISEMERDAATYRREAREARDNGQSETGADVMREICEENIKEARRLHLRCQVALGLVKGDDR